ncbi:hypothetical protein PROFUN_10249 [Planoprotostelium fungivorum]|uniref:Uncharacterized protein n=1 Tax=Planoprotostelium fungivorum TaxID=1890364 RepID=A0A2P6NEI8_9EUKA|nr:hypothetical protein PROFUN_10249 [Planoprotostelium fungivorum]
MSCVCKKQTSPLNALNLPLRDVPSPFAQARLDCLTGSHSSVRPSVAELLAVLENLNTVHPSAHGLEDSTKQCTANNTPKDARRTMHAEPVHDEPFNHLPWTLERGRDDRAIEDVVEGDETEILHDS